MALAAQTRLGFSRQHPLDPRVAEGLYHGFVAGCLEFDFVPALSHAREWGARQPQGGFGLFFPFIVLFAL